MSASISTSEQQSTAAVAHNQSNESFQPSALDLTLIKATQQGLPMTARPYHTLGEQLGISADEVMARLQRMLDMGVIRRIAAVPNHYRLGYKFNGMTVWDVPDSEVRKLGQLIGLQKFVSHCYHRPRHLPNWPYNLFAMVHGRTQEEVDGHILALRELLGEHVRHQDVLFSKRILKKTGLRI